MSYNYNPNYQNPNYPPSNEVGGEKPYYDNEPQITSQPANYNAPPQNQYYNNPQYNSQNYQTHSSPVSQNYYPPQNPNIYYQPYVNVNNNPTVSSPLVPAKPLAPQNSFGIAILNYVLIGISIIDIILQAIFKRNTFNLVVDIINLFCSILIIILYYLKINLKNPCVGSYFITMLIIFFMMGGLGLGLGLSEFDDIDAVFFVSLFTGIFFLIGRTVIFFCLIPLTCNCTNQQVRF